jgi:hypothetical protein
MMLDEELLQRVVKFTSPFCWKSLGAASSWFRSAVAALPPAPLLSLVGAGDEGVPIDVDLLSGFNLTRSPALLDAIRPVLNWQCVYVFVYLCIVVRVWVHPVSKAVDMLTPVRKDELRQP